MAWKVALAPTPEPSTPFLEALVHEMPIWAAETNERLQSAPTVREGAGAMWQPEPAYTLFKTSAASTAEEACEAILGTLREHHPRLAAVLLIGTQSSSGLESVFQAAGFEESVKVQDELLFRIPLSAVPNVPLINLDALKWKEPNDFYLSFFQAVGAPSWHGNNLDAFIDSVAGGGINQLEVPYRIVIRNSLAVNDYVYGFLKQLESVVERLAVKEGCPVALSLEYSETLAFTPLLRRIIVWIRRFLRGP